MIAVVLWNIGLVRDIPYTGPRGIDLVGAVLSVIGMGGVVLGILAWQEGGEYVGLIIGIGVVGLVALARWLVRQHRAGKVTVLDPDLFRLPHFRLGITQQTLQQITLGGAMIATADLPPDLARVRRAAGGAFHRPLSVTMFFVAMAAGRRAGKRRPAAIIRAGFALAAAGMTLVLAVVPRATSGWHLRRPAGDRRRGSGSPRLPAQQLHARPDRARSASARPRG